MLCRCCLVYGKGIQLVKNNLHRFSLKLRSEKARQENREKIANRHSLQSWSLKPDTVVVLLIYWWECDGRHLCACDVAGAGDVAWQSVPRLAHASNERRAATDRARATRRNHQHSTGQRRHLLLRYDRRRLLLLIVLHRGLFLPVALRLCIYAITVYCTVKGKGSPYSITKRRVPDLIPVLGSSLQVMWVINPAVGCHYFLTGPQLPVQPLIGLLPYHCLVNRGTMGVNSLPKTVTRQHRDWVQRANYSATEPPWLLYVAYNGLFVLTLNVINFHSGVVFSLQRLSLCLLDCWILQLNLCDIIDVEECTIC